MGLVSTVPVRRDVPGEDGQWVEFRALSAKQLRKAARARQVESAELLRAYGGDLMSAMRSGTTSQEEVEQAAADPLNTYDAETLLALSIADWSYDAPVKSGIAQLDEPTEKWAAGEVLRISGVMAETDDERGNG